MLHIPTKWQASPINASICPSCGGPIIHKSKCKPKAPITRERANGILRTCETSLRNTYRKRWGHYLPDNEHALHCLGVLLRVMASQTDIEADRHTNRLANAASVLKPSMTQQAAERLAESIIAGPKYDPCELRKELGYLLGEEIQLTEAEWLDLKLDIRNIIPPVSEAEMVALRKQRKLARQRLRRAKKRAANPSREGGRPKLDLSDAERAERRREQRRASARKRRAATGKDVDKNPEASGRKKERAASGVNVHTPRPSPATATAAVSSEALRNGKTVSRGMPTAHQTTADAGNLSQVITAGWMLPWAQRQSGENLVRFVAPPHRRAQ